MDNIVIVFAAQGVAVAQTGFERLIFYGDAQHPCAKKIKKDRHERLPF
jgi:hypothetical protein